VNSAKHSRPAIAVRNQKSKATWQVDEVTRQAETRPGERLSYASSQSRCFSMPVVWAQLDSALHRDLISTCV
jgi:hypothetical protein